VDPLDIYRAANLLVQQHRPNAKLHAIDRALDMRAAGDERGEVTWLRVFDAVLELQFLEPVKGQAVH
jgi:hypothetical protein